MTDDSIDQAIKSALASAQRKGQLKVVAAVTGFSVKDLQRMMRAETALTLFERTALKIHLNTY